MRLAPLVTLLSVFAYLSYSVYQVIQRHQAHLASGLPPFGSGSIFKDLAAYFIVSIPRIVRLITHGTAAVRASDHGSLLEGYHTHLQFNQIGSNVELQASPHFAENYYFWAHSPSRLHGSTDFVLTTRLSFYGVGAAHVVPWFTFSDKGDEWNLPDEFESKCLPHNHTSDPRLAVAPGLGELLFELVSPLRQWRLTYSGLVQNKKTGAREHVDAVFDIEFRDQDLFLYQIMWDELAAALAMSGKHWDAAYFQDLRAQNQERYASRSRSARGSVVFQSGKMIDLPVLQSSRDHNWGIRNWLYIYRYLWWPPVHFDEPLVIDGVAYTSFTGSLVEYGKTFSDLAIGGLMSDDGHCASFSGATSMLELAKDWFQAPPPGRGKGIGEALAPSSHRMTIGILHDTYMLEVIVHKRGSKFGLWSHSFMLAGGDFEIHEALTFFEFKLRRAGSAEVLFTTTASGLWEFGAPLVQPVQ